MHTHTDMLMHIYSHSFIQTQTHTCTTHTYTIHNTTHTFTFADTHICNTHIYRIHPYRHSDTDTHIYTDTLVQTQTHTHIHIHSHRHTLAQADTHICIQHTDTHSHTCTHTATSDSTLKGWAGSWPSHLKKDGHRLRSPQKQMGRQRMFLDKYKWNASPGPGAGVMLCRADLQGLVLPGRGIYKDNKLEYLQGCRQSPASWSQLSSRAVSADRRQGCWLGRHRLGGESP